MQVRIGVTYIPREIEIELGDDADPDDVRASVEQAMTGGGPLLWLTDRKGHQVGIAVDKLAYVDLGTGSETGRIGFGAP